MSFGLFIKRCIVDLNPASPQSTNQKDSRSSFSDKVHSHTEEAGPGTLTTMAETEPSPSADVAEGTVQFARHINE